MQKKQSANKREFIRSGPLKIHVSFGEKHIIQVGDKLLGDGNKRIISIFCLFKICLIYQMEPLDLVLNPLGVPLS
jgi:DNA-directed RNA polymerase beta subunit